MGTWKQWTLPFRRRETHKHNRKPPPTTTTTTTTTSQSCISCLFDASSLETTAAVRVRSRSHNHGRRPDLSGIEAPRNSLDSSSSSSRIDLDIPFAIQIAPERKSMSAAEGMRRTYHARTGNVVARLMGLDLPPPPPRSILQPRHLEDLHRAGASISLPTTPRASSSSRDHRFPRLSFDNKENLSPSTLLELKSTLPFSTKKSKLMPPPPPPRRVSSSTRSRRFEEEKVEMLKAKAKANTSPPVVTVVTRGERLRCERRRTRSPRRTKWLPRVRQWEMVGEMGEVKKVGEVWWVAAEVERRVWESLVDELVAWWIR